LKFQSDCQSFVISLIFCCTKLISTKASTISLHAWEEIESIGSWSVIFNFFWKRTNHWLRSAKILIMWRTWSNFIRILTIEWKILIARHTTHKIWMRRTFVWIVKSIIWWWRCLSEKWSSLILIIVIISSSRSASMRQMTTYSHF
jgi:hypothetical protein